MLGLGDLERGLLLGLRLGDLEFLTRLKLILGFGDLGTSSLILNCILGLLDLCLAILGFVLQVLFFSLEFSPRLEFS